MFSPMTMKKVNILILRLNKLSMKIFAEFLKSEFVEVYRGVEVQHTLENHSPNREMYLCDVPKWDVT